MKRLNPLTWISLALQIVGGAILFIALAFLGNWWLEDYYTKDLKEAQAQATAKADAIVTARNLENERRKNEALTAQKQKLESNLADARSADAFVVCFCQPAQQCSYPPRKKSKRPYRL